LCGGRKMGEYLPADKLIISAACGSDRFHHPAIRVLPSAGSRAELTDFSVPSIGYALRRRPGFSIKYAGMNEISIG